jgi:small subunit ribosomal protein S20
MANMKSQIKRNRQNEVRRVRNKGVRSQLRTEARGIRETVAGGDTDAAREQLREVSRQLDKAASKGAIHRNTAARRKSKLARAVESGS